MSVELEPSELGFKRPFSQEVTQVLRLHNPNSSPVAFKVKTTAPKQYCVRPNSGRIDAGAEVEVQVLLQAMKEDPPLDTRCRDKFLVQSIALDAEKEQGNIQNVWQNIEQTAKSSIHEKKIRVVFLPADGSAAVNGVSHLDESSIRDSPTPAPRTPQRGSEPTPVKSEAGNGIGATVSGAAAAVANAVPTSSEELKTQLAEAKATIQRLQAQAQESVLRQRKTDAANKKATESSSSNMAVQQASAGGVPVSYVALLCLLCFLIAYIFF